MSKNKAKRGTPQGKDLNREVRKREHRAHVSDDAPLSLDMAEVKKWKTKRRQRRPLIEGIVRRCRYILLTAEQQTGKSLFMLWLCPQLVRKGELFERFKIHPVKRVLYLVLEDPKDRVQERLLDMRRGGLKLPELGSVKIRFCHNLQLSDEGFKEIKELIKEFRPQVIILDTYQKATSGLSSFDDTKQTPIIHRLSNMTRNKGLTLFVLDHPRKANSKFYRSRLSMADVKGTGAKAQNADVIILMNRKGDQIDVEIMSKDDEDLYFRLQRSPPGSREPKFSYIRDLTVRVGEEREEQQLSRLIAAMRSEYETPKTIRTRGGDFSAGFFGKYIKILLEKGGVEHNGHKSKRSKYRLKKGKVIQMPSRGTDDGEEIEV